MNLQQVRRWARRSGVSAARFRRVSQDALLHVTSRVVQAIHRESGLRLRFPTVALPFRRLEVTSIPYRTVPSLLGALKNSVKGTEFGKRFGALRADFENSVANVTLNRLLGPRARSIEPAYQGHQYWPLPALRVGPSLEQVLACSHLTRKPVALPLLEVDDCRLVSSRFGSHAAFQRARSGLKGEALVPVHPWQLELTPVVRELLAAGEVRISSRRLAMIPLASQRTCRILSTGYDVKLPVDATLTGEHRLLYRLNLENAPVVSALAAELLPGSGLRTLGFQLDLASVFHKQQGNHLSAIVRPPVKARAGEVLVPAINLWSGPHRAREVLKRVPAEKFFTRYCRVLMEGPVRFYTECGMAFEPHIQNVYIGLRDALPARIVLRDLDNSILDPRRVRGRLRALGGAAGDTWRHMPPYEDGGRRMVLAMTYGHLGEVMWRLAQDHAADPVRLLAIVDATWDQLGAGDLRRWSETVKTTLRTRLARTTRLRFVRQ
jgi:siderophore synthetase component